MSKGAFPDMWKEANVSPLFKKDDPSSVSNYRPISLLNTIGKVMEKIVHKHMFNFFLDQHAITFLQSGFVPGESTVNQLVDIYNTFFIELVLSAPIQGMPKLIVRLQVSVAEHVHVFYFNILSFLLPTYCFVYSFFS